MTPSDGEPSDESRIEAIRIAFSKVAHGALAAHLKGFTSGVLASDLIIIVCLAPCGGGRKGGPSSQEHHSWSAATTTQSAASSAGQ